MTCYLFGEAAEPIAARLDGNACGPALYDAACAAVGVDPFVRAPQDCRFLQPALVALVLARWKQTDDQMPSTVIAGEGVGELAALAAAGAMSNADAIWLAAVRGRLMSRVTAERGLAALVIRNVGVRVARQLARSHDLRMARDDAPR